MIGLNMVLAQELYVLYHTVTRWADFAGYIKQPAIPYRLTSVTATIPFLVAEKLKVGTVVL